MTLLDERPPMAPEASAEPAPSAQPTSPEPPPVVGEPGATSRADEKLRMLRRARRSAVGVTVFIALGSFGLSFYSLWDMASQLAWPGYIAWLWPLIVDGMIIVATMSLVAFGGYSGQKSNQIYSWCVLAFGAVVSMSANFIHPLLPHLTGQDQGPVTAGSWLGAGISCIPPIALLACTHLLARLWAFTPEDELTRTRARRGRQLRRGSGRAVVGSRGRYPGARQADRPSAGGHRRDGTAVVPQSAPADAPGDRPARRPAPRRRGQGT